jgi:hypothetical protein
MRPNLLSDVPPHILKEAEKVKKVFPESWIAFSSVTDSYYVAIFPNMTNSLFTIKLT